ncbi:hypothetical protein SNEBB_010926 [Seison nebaliae]|nr:hypothetical protein SNEBB_010926 [Seison nebaliae]
MESSSLLNRPLITYDDNGNPIPSNTIITMAAHNLSHIAGAKPAGHRKRRMRNDSTPLPSPNHGMVQNALESTVVQQQKEIDSLKSAFRQLTPDASLAYSPAPLAESLADISIISAAIPLPDISGSTRSRSKQDDQYSKWYQPHQPSAASRYHHGRAIMSRSKKADPSKKPANKRMNRQRGSCSGHQLTIIPPRSNRQRRSSVLVSGLTTTTKAIEINEFLSTKEVRPISIARLLPKDSNRLFRVATFHIAVEGNPSQLLNSTETWPEGMFFSKFIHKGMEFLSTCFKVEHGSLN